VTGEEIRRELRTISRTSTAGLAPEPRPRLPKNATAVSTDSSWAILIAWYPSTCSEPGCGKRRQKRQRVAYHLRTGETRCPVHVQHLVFEQTDYGRRRKQGHQAHQHDRQRRAARGARYREEMREQRAADARELDDGLDRTLACDD
jgi:hypothetical protein